MKDITDTIFKPSETWRIMKNIVIISLAFMVQFTAYSGAANLQSSINAEAGLGTASLAAVYAGLIISNIFLPVVVIKWLGTKWAMSLSFLTYMPYIAAQLYPRFYTMIPAGLMVGLGGGPLWCSKCTYISAVSEAQSKISGVKADALLVRFFGLFFMIFQVNQVWGNLISSLVLTSGDNVAAVTAVNASMIPQLCGARFTPSADAAEAFQPQPPEKIQMLSGIYLACMAGAALIVAVGVDSMKRYDTGKSGSGTGLSGMALLAVTMKLMMEPKQLMLVTVNIFIGLQQAFFGADFTAAFVSCAIGTGTVGFVMMTFGIADAVGCIVTGYLAKITGRVPLICGAMVVHTALFATLLTWRPQPHLSYVLYIIAVLWGLCDSVWLVQINAYYGIAFPGREEAAYANFRLWESVGFIVAYLLFPYMTTTEKTYLLLAVMFIGVLFYFIVEYRDRESTKPVENNKKDLYISGLDNVAFQPADKMPASREVVFGSNEKWRINRNIFVLGFAFMVQFTAFHGAANLQSSVNTDAAAGTFTLAAIYFSLILSNIFLPAMVIKWLGCKWTVAVSFIAYMPFIAAQFYPRLYSLVPAGMMVGFGGGPLWCAKCTYLSVVAEPYAKLSGISAEVLVVRFFGLFFMFYQMAQIWGNLVSSAILSSSLGEVTSYLNETLAPKASALVNVTEMKLDFGATCGVNFCSGSMAQENVNLKTPSALKIQMIAGIYLACMVSACLLVVVGVDSLTRYNAGRQPAGQGLSGARLLAVTLRQLRHRYQLLLLPVIGYIGAEQAFMAADFTQAFVGCAYGISNIGFVMICFGAFNAAAAPLAGALVKTTGRYPVMVTALLLNLILLSALLLWRPDPEQWLVFFLLAAIWGTADAVWLVQVNALSGILFPGNEEAAYSNFRLWESTGSVLAYASAPYLCVRTRLYILIGLLLLGFSGYSTIELMEYRVKRAHHRERNFELVTKKAGE
ncbi:uncharacterized protein [Epargyreus clarus]|uniref:uncharacterized protein n=1 Tax=Epargyreus clarus TaxID=520877 RepID=UPI003C2DCED2